jgi:competence protein ComEC
MSAIARAYSITVEDLMTANELTDPNVLHVGQTLTIPTLPRGSAPTIEATTEPSPTASSSATLPPTLTPSGPALVEIGQVLGSSDLETEVVVLRNRGGAASLEGWSLSDAEGNIFTFPALTLFTDTQLRVHSITGRSTPSDLYWGREKPAWNGGELITLRDSDGDVVDTYIVP